MNTRHTAEPAATETIDPAGGSARQAQATIEYEVMPRHHKFMQFGLLTGAAAAVLVFAHQSLQAQVADRPEELAPLKSLPVPGLPQEVLSEYVSDKQAAIRLGKLLYWDTRVGSDNKTSCASCHFHAGADNRSKNQINPGLLAGDKSFQLGGLNYQLTEADFPLTKYLPAPLDTASARIADTNDVIGSQGVFTTAFTSTEGGGKEDKCSSESDAIGHGGTGFNIGGINTRRVAPRNSPSVINAVFNFRNFWDGRANNVANGADPFGMRNSTALVWKHENGLLRQQQVTLPGASLVSQGSGPPLSANEMSCAGRTFAMLGRKLLDSVPLTDQEISPTDSVLGKFDKRKTPYSSLIRQAFKAPYWNAPSIVRMPPGRQTASQDLRRSIPSRVPDKTTPTDQVSQLEANFALYFGIALQLYQETLVSDDTPFDRFASGDRNALTEAQKQGLILFQGKAKCINCHSGAAMTNASFRNVINERLEPMAMAGSAVKTYDNGFYNIGVRPTEEDIGLGETDPFALPMSETLMYAQGKESLLGNGFDPGKYPRPSGNGDVSTRGAFKTPGLRNVELTGPYFHNGGKATLMQVVDFYNRGGDFRNENAADLAPDMQPLGLTEDEKRNLVSFLLALTDDRVRFERPPFDRPSICIPDGHEGDHRSVAAAPDKAGQAKDVMRCLPAVGSSGNRTGLKSFLGIDHYKH
ncbi:cytochrome-c peroxidase [Noviherbaspirillum malthae]|jgi:cytochrome c peroxidase|uniref:cytochrome-c peroxidase n=1 Tax=Noviherbaspirillum malthae TaxID=1260987 RepID=UPI001E331EE7|nr:cytochrome c peroxidase [Noviherbaspirillum malthae]